MKFKSLLLIVFFYLIIVDNVFPQQILKDSLALEEALKLTLINQPLLDAALEQINAADARINSLDKNYYPQVDAKFNYVRIGPIPSLSFEGLDFKLAPANNYDAHISATQLVYDFGKWDALLDLTKSYKLSAQDKIGLIKNDLTYQTVQSFYTILFIEKSIEVKEEQINTLKEHLDIATKKLNTGSATDFDVLTTRVRIADAENQKIDIENDLNKAKINLKNLLNISSDKELNLIGQFEVDSASFDLTVLLNEAFNNRPEIKLAKDVENSFLLSKKAATREDLPSLNVFGQYGFKNGFVPNLDVMRGNWSLGVNATVPIFNGNYRDAKIDEAEANLKSSEADIIALKKDITVQVQQAFTDYNASLQKIVTTQLQVQQAEQAVLRAEIQYRDGVITNLDLLDAETSLAQAKLNYLQVQFRNVLSFYNLKKVIGVSLY